MQSYLDLLAHVRQHGADRSDRTGTGTRSLFGWQLRCNLADSFPLLTTKKLFFKGIVEELIWFLSGDTSIHPLNAAGVHIWDDWADEEGRLGPVYGRQWRAWLSGDGDEIDQISNLITQLKTHPESRRHIVCSWNVGQLKDMALPPCHCLFQFYVVEGRLSCQLYQRSADVFLGVPFNIASYALLTHMIAQVCDLEVGEFIHSFGDVHLYHNHFDQADLQLSRTPGPLPQIELDPSIRDIFAFRSEHIKLTNYHAAPRIPAPIAV